MGIEDGIGSESCPVDRLVIRNVEPSVPATTKEPRFVGYFM
jgi:hypothetical protein